MRLMLFMFYLTRFVLLLSAFILLTHCKVREGTAHPKTHEIKTEESPPTQFLGTHQEEVDLLSKQINRDLKQGNKGLSFFNKLIRMAELTRWGVGVSVAATAGLGTVYGLELLHIEKGNLAVYCAPGFSALTEVGSGLGVSLIKTFGCKTNEDYTGNFLTIAGSGPEFFLKLGAASWSWGANFDHFLSQLEHKANIGVFNVSKVIHEIGPLLSWLITWDKMASEEKKLFKAMICMSAGLTLKSQDVPEVCHDLTVSSSKESQFSLETLGEIDQFLAKYEYNIENALLLFTNIDEARFIAPNILALLDSFEGAFSGCNSIVVGGGVGLSKSALGPVSGGVVITHYTLAMEMDLKLNRVREGLQSINKGFQTLDQFCPESRDWLLKDAGRLKKVMTPVRPSSQTQSQILDDFDE